MGRSLFKTFIVLSALMLGGLMARESRAEWVALNFTAIVVHSEGTADLNGGEVLEGSTLHGVMNFDTATADANPSQNLGDYHFSGPPNGITILAGNNLFRTGLPNFGFRINIEDSVPNPGTAGSVDEFQGEGNLIDLATFTNGNVAFLIISDTDFMSSDALPTTAPTLPPCGINCVISITGTAPGNVQTHIVAYFQSLTRAEPVTFNFTATVDSSTGTEGFGGGAVLTGSTLLGSMTFEAPFLDEDITTTGGFYDLSTPPNGINVKSGSNVFQTDTDPSDVHFIIITTDAVPVPGSPNSVDQFSVFSSGNLLPSGTSGHGDIDFLMSNNADFMSSDALPIVPPVIQPGALVKISGLNQEFIPFQIEASVDTLVPPTVEGSLDSLKTFVGKIDPANLKNPNMGTTLSAKIDAALALLALIETETDPTTKASEIADLRNQLTNDLLAKGNGCGSAPDKNDWIVNCTEQQAYQALINAILALLNTL
jgi:hypothetical protein